eukprot:CAMPEP_0202448368 /NCGR_PEP_ID=MMETSP1360-20130828/7176_1 /ASSEMBLY_ACC=CAM_ASM_000848 /TAXON_ID=515479 /ORGANISM="Licmophora paradoxa, Strain CCMP2313" /LENGTH=346 /DNA_ID=CAMNT_0049065899 /DNA_START=96 /DNA_END=1136 /DNA_ORIENTATION=+
MKPLPLKRNSSKFMERIFSGRLLRYKSTSMTSVTPISDSSLSMVMGEEGNNSNVTTFEASSNDIDNNKDDDKEDNDNDNNDSISTVDTYGWERKAELAQKKQTSSQHKIMPISNGYLELMKARVNAKKIAKASKRTTRKVAPSTDNSPPAGANKCKKNHNNKRDNEKKKLGSKQESKSFELNLLVAYADAVPEGFDQILDDVVHYGINYEVNYGKKSSSTRGMDSPQVIATYFEETVNPQDENTASNSYKDNNNNNEKNLQRKDDNNFFASMKAMRIALLKWGKMPNDESESTRSLTVVGLKPSSSTKRKRTHVRKQPSPQAVASYGDRDRGYAPSQKRMRSVVWD